MRIAWELKRFISMKINRFEFLIAITKEGLAYIDNSYADNDSPCPALVCFVTCHSINRIDHSSTGTS